MKIAINRCHGGFSISGKAAKILVMKESPLMVIHTHKEWYGNSEPSEHERWVDIGDNFEASPFLDGPPSDTLRKDGIIYNFSADDEQRSHPDLINVIEELGDEAIGCLADIKIVEIPDNVKYTIEEYDGLEWVAEKHRIWS